MPRWTLGERPLRVNDTRDRTSAVDHGWRFSAVNRSGAELTIRVMQLRECLGVVSVERARAAVVPFLNDVNPPTMLILTGDGRFRPQR